MGTILHFMEALGEVFEGKGKNIQLLPLTGRGSLQPPQNVGLLTLLLRVVGLDPGTPQLPVPVLLVVQEEGHLLVLLRSGWRRFQIAVAAWSLHGPAVLVQLHDPPVTAVGQVVSLLRLQNSQ